MSSYPENTAAAAGLSCCHVCYKLAPMSEHHCPRCDSPLHVRKPDSIQRTVALIVTAALLYIPANILPIMTTTQLGSVTDSTILGGVVLLIHHESYPIAAVIFIASVLVPLSKLFALSWLCWSVTRIAYHSSVFILLLLVRRFAARSVCLLKRNSSIAPIRSFKSVAVLEIFIWVGQLIFG